MHPAYSVIFFTVLSGLGLGLMNIAFASIVGGHSGSERTFYMLILAMILLSLGLLSSLWHLGHAERSWRALSQWRSSWLSREGVMAMMAYIAPILWVGFYKLELVAVEQFEIFIALFGLLINIVTIHCTAMIYASLRPIPAWHNFFTPMNYQLLSLMSGFVFAEFLISLWGIRPPPMPIFVMGVVCLCAIGKVHYWRYLRLGGVRYNINQATGIAGDISVFDAPHGSRNYLMREMIFEVARSRRVLLQRLVLLLAFLVPFCYAVSSYFLTDSIFMIIGGVSCLSLLLGLLFERWLFFACAEHSVSLYYGRAGV